jgi:hypothetical protein
MRAALFVAALVLAAPGFSETREAPTPAPWSAQKLWDAWPQVRISPPDPFALKHAGLRSHLDALQARHPGLLTIVKEGTSLEGRPIPLLRLGTGPTGILLWSQMHGDEPTATAALLDLTNWLGVHRSDPAVQQLLSRLTLWIVPMLNPDGTERAQRRNAQEIDINRDALHLSTPEGRFLKAVRDQVQPAIGFNLHNQSPNLRVGKKGLQAALSLLAVPGDEEDSQTPGTRRSKQLAVLVHQLASTFAAGRVARYDADYTERAFGDSMTRWGTATLLVETGGWHGPAEAERLVRLNFTVLLGSLAAVADESVATVDPEAYSLIPVNERDALSTLVVRNLRLAGGRGFPPFKADLAFLVPGAFAGDSPRSRGPALLEVGDLSHAIGLADLDGNGMLAVPWPLQVPTEDWPSLTGTLRTRGLTTTDEATILAASHSLGEAAVAKRGFAGAVLLYRRQPTGQMQLSGAVLRGGLVGDLAGSVP